MPAPTLPAVAWLGSPVTDRVNMLQTAHYVNGTGIVQDAVRKADNVNQWTIYNTSFVGGANVNTVSLGALTTAPDGTNTGQKIVEATNNGLHQMQAFSFMLGGLGTGGSVAGMRVRLAVIAKAAERTRMALQVVAELNNAGVTTVFDLAGGQIGVAGTVFGSTGQQDPFGIGFRWHSYADTITALGNGWYLCVMDVGSGYSTTNIGVTLSLDNGSGTAAASTAYAGDGSSGIYTWRSSLLPPRFYALSARTFFDDFDSINTIDVSDTQAPGFNWYPHMNFPWLPAFTTTPAGNYSVASSILSCVGVASTTPNLFVLNTCAPPPTITYVGDTPNYVGTAFFPPFFIEANLHWDDSVSTTHAQTSSWWSFNLKGMFTPNAQGFIDSVHMEIDVYEDALATLPDTPRTSWLQTTKLVAGGAEVFSFRQTTDKSIGMYPVWKNVVLYNTGTQLYYSGVFYNALQPSGPGGANPPTVPGTNGAIWNPMATPSASLVVDFGQFHTYSQLLLPYVSQSDPGVLMIFFDGISISGTCTGPDVLGPTTPLSGGMKSFSVTDHDGFPFFIQTGVNYGVFYDWVWAYQTPQAALSSLNIHDSSAKVRQTQALDPSAAGTGPWQAGRAPIDGVAGVNQAIITPYGIAVDDSALQLPVQEITSSGSTQTSVTSTVSSVPLFGPNPARLGISVFNESTQSLFININSGDSGNGLATTSIYSVKVAPNTRYEFPNWWVGGAYGTWDVANGFARITEMT